MTTPRPLSDRLAALAPHLVERLLSDGVAVLRLDADDLLTLDAERPNFIAHGFGGPRLVTLDPPPGIEPPAPGAAPPTLREVAHAPRATGPNARQRMTADVLAFLAEGEANTTQLHRGVRGNDDTLARVLRRLVRDGEVLHRKQGNAQLYRLANVEPERPGDLARRALRMLAVASDER